MADDMQFNSKSLEVLVTILRSSIEQELVQAGYEVRKLLKQGLDAQNMPQMPELSMPQMFQPTQQPKDQTSIDSRLAAVEELLKKIDGLVQTIDQRDRKIVELEDRLATLENQPSSSTEGRLSDNSLVEPSASSQQVADLENRIATLENSIKNESDTDSEGDRGETLSLVNRITHLERIIQRGSVIPRIVDRQGEAIQRLANRLSHLESSTNPTASNYIPDYTTDDMTEGPAESDRIS